MEPQTPRTVNDGETDACWICGDPADHAGQAHSEAAGDGLTRYDIIDWLTHTGDLPRPNRRVICVHCAGSGGVMGGCPVCDGSGDLSAPAGPVGTFGEMLVAIEAAAPSSLAAHLDSTRPYDGQPHTFTGERGRQGVHGLTLRDLMDCYVRACYEASGLPIEQWPGTVYDLPWAELDPIALGQRLCYLVERRVSNG